MVTLGSERGSPVMEPHIRWRWQPQPWWLVFVIASGIGVPLLIAGITGNLAIPHNDSWAYSLITRVFWRTGQIRLVNYNDMSLIGLLFMVGPLGTSIVAQQVGVAIAGAVAVWCCYSLVAAFTSAGRALVAATMLVAWPGFANLTTSFMTDIPVVAASWLSLVVGRRAMRDDSRCLLALSLAVGVWGTTIREEALAAPIAVVVVGLLRRRSQVRVSARFLIAVSVVGAAFLLAFMYWRQGLPNGQNPHLVFHLSQFPAQVLDASSRIYFTLAAMLAPLTLLVARPWRWTRRSWISVAFVAALFFRMALMHSGLLVSSNGGYLYSGGEYQYVIGGSRSVVPAGLWTLLTPIAVIGGLVLAGELTANSRRSDAMLNVFTLVTFAAIIGVAVGSWPWFDRYLIPLIPGFAAPLVAGQRRSVRRRSSLPARELRERVLSRALPAIGVASFAVTGVISTMLALNSFAFDATRWHVASKFVAAGLPANRIDAGIEWDGWHTQGPKGENAWAAKYVGAFDWAQAFYTAPPCVVEADSAFTPGDGVGQQGAATLLATPHYRTFLVSGESKLYVYATHVPGCHY